MSTATAPANAGMGTRHRALSDAALSYSRFVLLSYRSTFLWRSSFAYFSNVVAMPVLFAAQFSYIGNFTGGSGVASRLAIGMTVYAIANIEISGIVQGAFHQKTYGTEDLETLARRGMTYRLSARIAGHCGNGLLSGVATLIFAALVLDVGLDRTNWAALAITAVIAAIAAASFAGLLSSAVSLLNDWVTLVIVGNGILTGLSGVVVPRRSLPVGLSELSGIIPFSHAVDAFRAAIAGAPVQDLVRDWSEAIGLSLAFLIAAVMTARTLETFRRRVN
jgi:ABC-2 type transport system permease protein